MIDQQLKAIEKMANNYPAKEYQKDYHIGMLKGLAEKQYHEMQSLKNEIKDLQIKLMEQK